jgi:hypothetical protein
MEIIRNYEEMLELAVSIVHPIEAVVDRLVTKGIVTRKAAIEFLGEIK